MKKIYYFIMILFFISVVFFIARQYIDYSQEKKILGYPEKHINGNSKLNYFINNRYYYKFHGSVYYYQGATLEWYDGGEEIDIKLPNSDPKTFVIIDNNYAKDKNNVYYWGAIVEKADPATFQPLDWPKAKDKNYYFSQTKIIGEVK